MIVCAKYNAHIPQDKNIQYGNQGEFQVWKIAKSY